MCLYPRLIDNPKYKSTKKNGGIIPPVPDERVKLVPIGCGNCIECRKQKARGWQLRLLEEVKHNKNGKFVTLTISNEQLRYLIEGKDTDGNLILETKTGEHIGKINLSGYNLDNAVAKLAVRRFLERWRKKYKKSVRHWLVTELGHNGTENIHLHGIIWTDENSEVIENIWKYGWVWKGKKEHGKITNYVNAKTVNYIIKYVTKIDRDHMHYKSQILCTHKPAIGHQYTRQFNAKSNKYNGANTNETYRTDTGHKISMPIYWRNKIYTDDEREQLWLHRLDKNERWIMGEKIDISNGYEVYDQTVKYYREINKELGYGDEMKSDTDKERKDYENKRRNLLVMERLQKAWAKEHKIDRSGDL